MHRIRPTAALLACGRQTNGVGGHVAGRSHPGFPPQAHAVPSSRPAHTASPQKGLLPPKPSFVTAPVGGRTFPSNGHSTRTRACPGRMAHCPPHLGASHLPPGPLPHGPSAVANAQNSDCELPFQEAFVVLGSAVPCEARSFKQNFLEVCLS